MLSRGFMGFAVWVSRALVPFRLLLICTMISSLGKLRYYIKEIPDNVLGF